jgi:hypothetical protein
VFACRQSDVLLKTNTLRSDRHVIVKRAANTTLLSFCPPIAVTFRVYHSHSVAEQSKARVHSRSLAGTAGSNTAGDMVSVRGKCVVLSGRGLCDGPIPRPEESYRLWCVIVCDLETSEHEVALGRVGLLRQKQTAPIGRSIVPSQLPNSWFWLTNLIFRDPYVSSQLLSNILPFDPWRWR